MEMHDLLPGMRAALLGAAVAFVSPACEEPGAVLATDEVSDSVEPLVTRRADAWPACTRHGRLSWRSSLSRLRDLTVCFHGIAPAM